MHVPYWFRDSSKTTRCDNPFTHVLLQVLGNANAFSTQSKWCGGQPKGTGYCRLKALYLGNLSCLELSYDSKWKTFDMTTLFTQQHN